MRTKREEAELLLQELQRRKGREDLYTFCKFTLGYSEMAPAPHRLVCDFLTNRGRFQNNKSQGVGQKKKHIELPRGAFKSSIVTIGYTLWSIEKDPNIRILIDNEVYNNSKAFLREIKGHMDNPEILKLHPNLEPNKRINDGWTESTVIVKARTKVRKEPTISCAGLDQIKVGMHYDKIIMDDLVSNRNVTTPEQIEKVIEHYKLALSLLEPDGELIVVGTRYHYNDLYGYIMEEEYDSFDHLILPAILDESTREKYGYPGEILFPSRLSPQFLEQQRASQGTYIFSCQYLLKPINEEEAKFKDEWLLKYKGKIIWENDKPFLFVDWTTNETFIDVKTKIPVKLYSAFDPASKKKKRADFSVIFTIAVTPNNEWFIVDMIRDKLNPRERVDKVFQNYHRWHFEAIGIEDVGFQDTVEFYCREQMRKTGVSFRIIPVKVGGRNKEDRILGVLQPRFENRQIYLPKDFKYMTTEGKQVNLVTAFEDEYHFFPFAKHDDMLDTLSQFEQVLPKQKDRGTKRVKGRAVRIIGGI